jgi:phosphate:Na+ symporter
VVTKMDFDVILGLFGGLGLFIYGMHLLSDSLRKLSLGLLKTLLDKMSMNRIVSMLVGVSFTSIVQSSSATSVFLIGFLNAGIISLAAALPVVFGANIGTTVTAQLVAFKLTKSALLFVFIGAVIYFFAKKDKNKNRGHAILGFGLLFLGLSVMTTAVKPLAGNEAIINLFITFGKQPVLGILTGLLVTAILQSSSTTIGMVIAFASAGLLDLPSAIYLVLGDNIGTCITALIASIGGRYSSKRLALGHGLFNITGTIIMLPFIPLYVHYMPMLSGDIARQIANTHTMFNIINTAIMLPLVPVYVKILNFMVPGEDYEKKQAMSLDRNLLITPSLAILAVVKELSVMLRICREMLDKARACTISYNHKLKNEISFDEESVDEMQRHITEYLVDLTKQEMLEKQRRLIPALLHSVNDIEKVGDYCEDITKVSQRIFEYNLTFSSPAQRDIETLFEKTDVMMKHTGRAMENNDEHAAKVALNVEGEINELIMKYRLDHIKRLADNVCTSDSGLVYSDILMNIERMNAHLTNIAQGILHVGKR